MTMILLRAAILGLVLVFTLCPAIAETALPAEFPPQAEFDAWIQGKMAKDHIVGCAVGLVQDNEVVYVGTYGFADLESTTPVTRASSFRWASISKPVTAVAAMQLWEMGELDLDRDVREYVPEFPEKEHPITTRQLLTHLGGMVHYSNGKVVRTRKKYDTKHPYTSVINALDRFAESPLVAVPGEKFSYTTHGYILLSAVIERAGEEQYWEQVRTRIAEPLGMTSFQPDHKHLEIPNRVSGYNFARGKQQKSFSQDVGWKLGGGGYTSTIDDLARFTLAMMRGELIKAETRSLMWRAQKTTAGEMSDYGFGFQLRAADEKFFVLHSGAQNKTRTRMVFEPKAGYGVVFMTNSEQADTRSYVDAFLPWVDGTRELK